MRSIKDSFQKDKELFPWWKAVVEDPRFALLTLYARSQILESKPSAEALAGALLYESLLAVLAEVEDSGQPMPSPGLHHMAELLPDKPHHD